VLLLLLLPLHFVLQVAVETLAAAAPCTLAPAPDVHCDVHAAASSCAYDAAAAAGGVRASFHVGDTPMDIQAALAADCIAVGVTTGVYTRQQLQDSGEGAASGKVVVLNSLEEVEHVLKVLQLD
jgi:phosphoglycolate phosphatase-like HAD superfamily hydrolase